MTRRVRIWSLTALFAVIGIAVSAMSWRNAIRDREIVNQLPYVPRGWRLVGGKVVRPASPVEQVSFLLAGPAGGARVGGSIVIEFRVRNMGTEPRKVVIPHASSSATASRPGWLPSRIILHDLQSGKGGPQRWEVFCEDPSAPLQYGEVELKPGEGRTCRLAMHRVHEFSPGDYVIYIEGYGSNRNQLSNELRFTVSH